MNFVYGELGRCHFQTQRFYNIIKYWLKIICCQDTKYVKIVYDILLNDLNTYPNKVSWVKLIRNLLGELGFMEAWLNQSVGDVKLFLYIVKQRLKDTFIQNWNARLYDSSRALFYRNFNIFCYKKIPGPCHYRKISICPYKIKTVIT